MGGQRIWYDGPRRGKVDVAVRPENIRFSDEGSLEGTLESQFYLGDVSDCRVRVGDALVRVIADGFEHKSRQIGQKVRLNVRSCMVFEDDGQLEKMLTIQT